MLFSSFSLFKWNSFLISLSSSINFYFLMVNCSRICRIYTWTSCFSFLRISNFTFSSAMRSSETIWSLRILSFSLSSTSFFSWRFCYLYNFLTTISSDCFNLISLTLASFCRMLSSITFFLYAASSLFFLANSTFLISAALWEISAFSLIAADFSSSYWAIFASVAICCACNASFLSSSLFW